MMMRALHRSSDLSPYVDMDVEALIRSREVSEDYNPNPNGYYQSALSDVSNLPDDTLVKVTVYQWPWLVLPQDFRVVVMTRNEESRLASFDLSFGGNEASTLIPYENGEKTLSHYQGQITLAYEDVMREPLAAFTFLAEAGWPIDPALAATFVDPTLHRIKQ